MKKYMYFVSYLASTTEGNASGNAEVQRDKELTHYDEILMIQQILKEKRASMLSVTIMHYHLLRVE
jgi:hypothetical protein